MRQESMPKPLLYRKCGMKYHVAPQQNNHSVESSYKRATTNNNHKKSNFKQALQGNKEYPNVSYGSVFSILKPHTVER